MRAKLQCNCVSTAQAEMAVWTWANIRLRREAMPKMKSNRGAAKRFRAKGNGGFKRGQSHLRHILTKKSSKRKRQLGQPAEVAKQDVPGVRRMLPYS